MPEPEAGPGERPPMYTTAADMRAFSRALRRQGKRVALVPTMGNLHEGHLALIDAAQADADAVVVSIYVNPTQFAAHEDFGVYPRTLAADLAKLAARGVTAVFLPDSLYARGQAGSGASASEADMVVGSVEGGSTRGDHETYIEVEQLQRGLCGKSRPHFFRGVATVVAKLFNIVEPDVAFFGRKDYQQWRILTRMARDLDFGVEVRGLPIVREPDGLAMSSRNSRLTPAGRQAALVIYKSLQELARIDRTHSTAERSAEKIQDWLRSRISEAGGKVDYAEVVDAEELRPVTGLPCPRPALVAVAAFFDGVRLIDNIELEPVPG